MASADDVQRYIKVVFHFSQLLTADVLFLKLTEIFARKYREMLVTAGQKLETGPAELDTSELVELLQQSAVERLTTYRRFEAQKFGSIAAIVITDFEAIYAYKRGDYQQCLQLSTQNVHTLLHAKHISTVPLFPEFIQFMDNDIVSLTALTLIVDPKCAGDIRYCMITQLTLSLYLMTQCQLKLHHSVTSLAQTLHYIKVSQRRHPVNEMHDQLTMKLTERKIMIFLAAILQC